MSINVLSLFDGMSCARIALDKCGFKINKYYASEIDKYAIKVSSDNYPDIVQVGDVTKIDYTRFEKIDLLCAGSPCQGFSFAGKQLNFKDPRSALFFEFVRALKIVKPKYFMLENVKMKKEFQDVISDLLGVQPIEINSSLVSAQNRRRLYWTNIPNIIQPNDKCIYLKDIIEDGLTDRHKSLCLDANYFKGGNLKQYFKKHRLQLVFNYSSSGRGNGVIEGRFTEAKKAPTLTAAGYNNRSLAGVLIDDLKWRKLTVLECKRLQTVPDNYIMNVSDSQAYKMLGNGWAVDVIAHIFKNMEF